MAGKIDARLAELGVELNDAPAPKQTMYPMLCLETWCTHQVRLPSLTVR